MNSDMSCLSYLEKAGLTFTLCAARNKNPIIANWPHKPHDAGQAIAHAQRGGNVGTLAGRRSNNVVWLDVDANAPKFLRTFPQLRNTLQSWREDAPDRRKFAIRITDRLPRSAQWRPIEGQPPEAELLSTGRQAVIVGIHPGGARYQLNDSPIIELTFAQLSAIWRQWTKTELN